MIELDGNIVDSKVIIDGFAYYRIGDRLYDEYGNYSTGCDSNLLDDDEIEELKQLRNRSKKNINRYL